MQRQKVVIMGAAGRDFHNFNVFFRDNPAYQVVAFTATQIPNIESRRYPSELAGNNYPDGIPIYPEEDLSKLISEHEIDTVVFAYSDVSHEYVMHKAAEAMATGADFMVMGTRHTMLQSKKPVVAVCAVRTGCGKSQTTRRVSKILREYGKKVVVVRHPMPYGYLKAQRVQRFATLADLDRHDCTIEEREEYEPHIVEGNTVYAGVEYSEILAQAEQEADIILWDGGNNDMPFFKPNLLITVVDPHRPGHETRYFPGETNLRMADIVVINKEDTASRENIEAVRAAVLAANPAAAVVDAASPISAENPELIKNK
ncbi:GTPase, partial [candidate division KSB1 bacterium]